MGTAVYSTKCRERVTLLLWKREKINTGGDEFCNQTLSTKIGFSQDQSFIIQTTIIREFLKVKILMCNIPAIRNILEIRKSKGKIILIEKKASFVKKQFLSPLLSGKSKKISYIMISR